MCKQYIAIAQCAPEDPAKGPLTFMCGQLHHHAAHRDTCEAAKGDCICFFGTCGAIETVVRSQPFDLASLSKMRCLPCTTREEQVGERRRGRDFLETKLLTRHPVTDEGMIEHAQMLKNCWNGASVCPYHDLEESEASKPPSTSGDVDEPAADEAPEDTALAAGKEKEAKDPSEKTLEYDDLRQDTEVDNAPVADPVEEMPASVTDAPSQPSEQVESTFDRKSFEAPMEDAMDAVKVKPALGIETSRWAPGGASRVDNKPESSNELNSTEEPQSKPRRDLYDAPTGEKGNTAYAGMAQNMRAFLGLA